MLWCRCALLLLLCVRPPACLTTSPCPPGCCCPGAGLLVLCESLGLRSLPRSVPLTTSALSVARNQLCDVDHLLRPFSGLRELSLSHNLLTRFPRGLPPSLRSLLLQENRITYITSGSLRQLENLTLLDLEDNRIRAIQPGALRGLHKLQVLTLKGNHLTSFPLNLPTSLIHLDLSTNCISVLDPPSLSALVNLQVLKINSNCLRSVPESAFDGLPRLRSLELNNNLWVCACDILYLYRWLLGDRLRMATDVVCSEPVHLAHRLLLNLSVVAICPRILKPKERRQQLDFNSTEEGTPLTLMGKLKGPNSSVNRTHLERSQEKTFGFLPEDPPNTRISLEHFTLETFTYEECLSLNRTQTTSPNHFVSSAPPSGELQKCRENITGQLPLTNTSDGTRPLLSTQRDAPWPTPYAQLQLDPTVVTSLLATLCLLVVLLILAVLLVLKKVLVRQQRVAPLDVGSGGMT